MMTIGVSAGGGWEILGLEVRDSEDGAFWTALMCGLRARGPAGVTLAVSDARLAPSVDRQWVGCSAYVSSGKS